jgi:hypothetical protein
VTFLEALAQQAKYNSYRSVITIEDGVHQPSRGEKVFIKVATFGKTGARVSSAELRRNDVSVRKLEYAQLLAFSNLFHHKMFSTVSNYREIKTVDAWRLIYGVREQSWEFHQRLSNEGMDIDEIEQNDIDVVNCRVCGILLPLRVASIDHQAPQSNGMMKAMCRVFRSIGCTVASGRGVKSVTMQSELAEAIGGDEPGRWDGNKVERHTLNEVGRMYYSMLGVAGMMGEFQVGCMNSGFNLRPVCPPCNSSLQNKNGF